MTKVWITRALPPEALDALKPYCEVEVWPLETPPPKSEILRRIGDLDAMLTMLTDPIDAEVIAAAGPRFRAISQMAVGYDNIHIPAATQRGIAVGHTPGVLTETTADMAWALLMAVARRVVEAHQEVQKGIWRPWGPFVLCGQEVYGATLGIIGFGRIGQAVARRAAGFSMRILYHDPDRHPELEAQLGVQYASLDDLLSSADFISLHAYLSESTRRMINSETLGKVKPGAILINTARGGMVDQEALYHSLKEGRLAGAGLDVTDPEPIDPSSPLLNLPNVIITPHIASASTVTRQKMALLAVQNLIAGLKGEPMPHCVNPEALTRGQAA